MAVTVKIQAGLGNQMFQYAVARSLALQKNTGLILDIFGFETDGERPYLLSRFNIRGRYATKREWSLRNQLKRQRYTPVRVLLQTLRCPCIPRLIIESEPGFYENLARSPGHLYLDGFWQDERYFREIRSHLLEEFTFRESPDSENAEYLRKISQENAVCLHIRRGDYASTIHGQEVWGLCPMDYYERAIALIRNRVVNPTFYIFSDDPEWASANFDFLESKTVVSHNVGKNDSEDLRLMMHCRHFIIANSTFSWWAAWLGQAPEKIVIAPKIWYLSEKHQTKDPVPDSWIRL